MECLSPLRKVIKSRVYWLPCSKCVNCNINRQNSWVFRLQQETKQSKTAYFVTLTYNDENIPKTVSKDTGEIINTLRYSDVQKYIKRLRKAQKGSKIKHYTVGEYGENTKRPHYHQIIFNAEAEKINSSWGHGHTLSGTVTTSSIRYVTKYMGKRINNTPEGAEKPKNVMSNGLGKNYLTPEVINHHKEYLINYIVIEGGKKIGLPQYYKDKLFDDTEKMKLRILNEIQNDADLQHLWDKCTSIEKLDFEISARVKEKDARAAKNERLKQKQSKSLVV